MQIGTTGDLFEQATHTGAPAALELVEENARLRLQLDALRGQLVVLQENYRETLRLLGEARAGRSGDAAALARFRR